MNKKYIGDKLALCAIAMLVVGFIMADVIEEKNSPVRRPSYCYWDNKDLHIRECTHMTSLGGTQENKSTKVYMVYEGSHQYEYIKRSIQEEIPND